MFGKNTQETPKTTEDKSTLPAVQEPPQARQEVRVDTIIGKGTRIVGTMNCQALLRVDGVIEGSVISEDKVVVNEEGLITGDVHAAKLTVGGELKGNAYIREKAEILSTGRLNGDIITRTLIMDENAVLEGKCSMNTSLLEQTDPPAEPESPVSADDAEEKTVEIDPLPL